MAPIFRRSRPIHSQVSNLPESRRPWISQPIRRKFAQGSQVAGLRPQTKEAGGGQGSGDGSGGRNPEDMVRYDPPCRADRPSPHRMRKPLGVPECQRLPGAAERKSWSHSKGRADTTRKQEEDAPDFAPRNGLEGGNLGNKVARRDRRTVHLLICHRPASGADWSGFPVVSPGPGLATGPLLRRLLHRATCPGRVCQVGPSREANGSRLPR
jgi:hypothetical protein